MRTLSNHRGTRMILFSLFCIFVLSNINSYIQAQTSGAIVNVCQTDWVDSGNYIQQTVCLNGDASQLTGYVETDDLGYYYLGGDSTFVVEAMSDAQIWDQSGLVKDAGMGNDYAYITPQINDEYTLEGIFQECYDPTGSGTYSNCTWQGPMDGLNIQGEVQGPSGVQGFITPKYVVVGVTYAPPGENSYVQYTNTNSVGNTTTISQSFNNKAGFSVSMSGGGMVPAGWFSGAFTVTATESTDYTQGSSNSSTTTVSKATTVAYKTNGTPNEAPVSNDYDYIWLWLNPELFVTYAPPVGSTPGSVVLTGYGMDPNDPVTGLPQSGVTYTAGPDIIEVQVGCLNGHFGCGSDLAWNNGEAPGSFVTSGLLARSWQSAANGYYWPSGEQSGLSFNDVCQILTFDPMTTSPSQCPTQYQNNYLLLNTLPSMTSDGRFTRLAAPPYGPNPIQYPIGAGTEPYSMVQTDSQSQSAGNSTQIKQAFSVSEKFSASAFFGLTNDSITFKESNTLTWNYSTLNTLTTTTTLTNALSITGPPDTPTYPSNEPTEYIGYQDNTFGTFVFVPVNYCQSSTGGVWPVCTP